MFDEFKDTLSSPSLKATKGESARSSAQPGSAAKSLHATSINRLRKPANRNKHTRKLAAKLAACAADQPCESQACPICRSKAVKCFVGATAACFRAHGFPKITTEGRGAKRHRSYESKDGRELAFVTIIPSSRIPIGELGTSDKVRRFIDRLKRILSGNNVSMAVFALDVSAIEHQSGKFQPHYKVHAHGFMFLDEFKNAAAVLRGEFPNKGNVKLGVHHRKYNGRASAIRYLLKEPKDRGIKLNRPLKNRNWKVSNRLRSAQHVEILQWMDQLGLDGRLIVQGAGTEQVQALIKRCSL
jgi:hypothetical protein